MKHKWFEHEDMRFGGRIRICWLCRKKQTWEDYQMWMRVVGYSWEPKVGRCPGKDIFEDKNNMEAGE